MEPFKLVPGAPFYHWSTAAEPMRDHLLFSYSRHAMLAFISYLTMSRGLQGINLILPEYMCHEVINALRPVCNKVCFFTQSDDFSYDLAALIAQCEAEDINVIMHSHLYGKYRPLDDVRVFCDDREIVLLEDCAHLPWFVLASNRQYSHAQFFTYRKLFALPYGASLQVCPEWREEFADFRSKRVPNITEPHATLKLAKWLAREHVREVIVRSGKRWERTYTELGSDPLKDYNELTGALEQCMQHLYTQGYIDTRKRNYEALRNVFSTRLNHWHYLDSSAENDVPYQFLFFKQESIDLVTIINKFLQHGISAVKGLELSSETVRRLGLHHPFNNQIGLPIHQDVTQEQIEHMKAVCLKVLS
jgi:hypothetical protein